MGRKINIVARTNGVGLDRDVDLVAEILRENGDKVTVSHCRAVSPLRRWFPQRKRYEVNIYMERIFSRWVGMAERNILIPNQERFPQRQVPLLRKIDAVFCKSKHAFEIFEKKHSGCQFVGFSSQDLKDSSFVRKEQGVLHLAGKSTLKGTELILKLWKDHPEWPVLTLVQCVENAPKEVPENVRLLSEYLSDEEIVKIYNEHRIHLCPSLSEGWGHYIVEGMSCGAVVVTTDGPPMNELIDSDRGLLVEVVSEEPRHLGVNFHVGEAALEAAIVKALELEERELVRLGENARSWFLQNREAFRGRFLAALERANK